VEGIIRPTKDLLRLSDLDRGGGEEGNGTETVFDVRVMAEGVRVERVGKVGRQKESGKVSAELVCKHSEPERVSQIERASEAGGTWVLWRETLCEFVALPMQVGW